MKKVVLVAEMGIIWNRYI